LEDGIPFADLYRGMSDEEGNLKVKCAHADGLHFSVEGYRQMGTIIYEDAVKAILENYVQRDST
jgi:lysophospholipase L1-like esterase